MRRGPGVLAFGSASQPRVRPALFRIPSQWVSDANAGRKGGAVPVAKQRTYHRPWYQRLLGLESRKSVISDDTLRMFQACASRLEADPALRAVVSEYNRSEMYAWFQSAVVHVWLCLGRMYAPAVEARELMSQEMSDHFFAEVERQLVRFGVTNPLAFNREFKRLAQIFHGTCVAYDKAYLAKDDDLFARAVWRNLLNQDVEQFVANSSPAEALVAYIKHQKIVLQYADPEAFVQGTVPFAKWNDVVEVGGARSVAGKT